MSIWCPSVLINEKPEAPRGTGCNFVMKENAFAFQSQQPLWARCLCFSIVFLLSVMLTPGWSTHTPRECLEALDKHFHTFPFLWNPFALLVSMYVVCAYVSMHACMCTHVHVHAEVWGWYQISSSVTLHLVFLRHNLSPLTKPNAYQFASLAD